MHGPQVLSTEWMLIGSAGDLRVWRRIDPLLRYRTRWVLVLAALKRDRTPREVIGTLIVWTSNPLPE